MFDFAGPHVGQAQGSIIELTQQGEYVESINVPGVQVTGLCFSRCVSFLFLFPSHPFNFPNVLSLLFLFCLSDHRLFVTESSTNAVYVVQC
jgi:hypothetical protein